MKFMSWVSSVCWDETLHVQEQPGEAAKGHPHRGAKHGSFPASAGAQRRCPRLECWNWGEWARQHSPAPKTGCSGPLAAGAWGGCS